jgi:acyl-coenzyme A thioesterase PaaI-like protein
MTSSLSLKQLRSMGIGTWIREGWRRASRLPGGRKLFSRALGVVIPYTGSIGAEVLVLEPGYAKVKLEDRRAVRNHLESIHAIALCNLGELTGNLALVASLPDDARFIVTKLAIEFKKKARGQLVAECRCDPPTSSERREYELVVNLRNTSEEVVATVVLTTLVGSTRAA